MKCLSFSSVFNGHAILLVAPLDAKTIFTVPGFAVGAILISTSKIFTVGNLCVPVIVTPDN
jgi:hypothetical protein